MMDKLRKNMKKVMWVITVLFIGGLFFWFGTGAGDHNTVARAGRTRIEYRTYQQRITQHINRMRQELEEDLTDAQLIEARHEVLSSMINQELRYQEASRIGITVPDQEVIETIRGLPQFQEDNVFNFQLYRQALRFSMNMTPEEFEDLIKRDLAIRKLERHILSSVRVTEPELKLRYRSKHGSLAGFEDKRRELENQLLQEKRTALYGHWARELHRRYQVEVNPEVAGLQ